MKLTNSRTPASKPPNDAHTDPHACRKVNRQETPPSVRCMGEFLFFGMGSLVAGETPAGDAQCSDQFGANGSRPGGYGDPAQPFAAKSTADRIAASENGLCTTPTAVAAGSSIWQDDAVT